MFPKLSFSNSGLEPRVLDLFPNASFGYSMNNYLRKDFGINDIFRSRIVSPSAQSSIKYNPENKLESSITSNVVHNIYDQSGNGLTFSNGSANQSANFFIARASGYVSARNTNSGSRGAISSTISITGEFTYYAVVSGEEMSLIGDSGYSTFTIRVNSPGSIQFYINNVARNLNHTYDNGVRLLTFRRNSAGVISLYYNGVLASTITHAGAFTVRSPFFSAYHAGHNLESALWTHDLGEDSMTPLYNEVRKTYNNLF